MNAEHDWRHAMRHAHQEANKAAKAQVAWTMWLQRAAEAKSRIKPERLAEIDDARLERVRSEGC